MVSPRLVWLSSPSHGQLTGSHNDQMVAIARGTHLLPFRTEKLSPFTPMVLPQGGRVGSRLSLKLRVCRCNVCRPFFYVPSYRLTHSDSHRLHHFRSYLCHPYLNSQRPMQPVHKHKAIAEILWWICTLIVIVIVLFPIYDNAPTYPFFFQNALLIAVFITFARYIFFLRITFLARLKWVKVAIIAAAAIFFFIVSNSFSDFRNFVDEKGLQTLVDHLHVSKQTSIINYIKHEMVFFGVGSIITGILLPIRMIISLWRMRNKGTV